MVDADFHDPDLLDAILDAILDVIVNAARRSSGSIESLERLPAWVKRDLLGDSPTDARRAALQFYCIYFMLRNDTY